MSSPSPSRTFDPSISGRIGEEEFRRIMASKEGVQEEEVEEMLAGPPSFGAPSPPPPELPLPLLPLFYHHLQ